MTIEIEAGASQPQCSMKTSRRPSFFEDAFFHQFVLNDTFTRAFAPASPFKMRLLGGNLFFRPIQVSISPLSTTEYLEPFNNCSTMKRHVTYARKD
jgi:hypothetical protein